MAKRNTLTLIIILALFVFAICALIYPLFGREEMRLGLDLQGGIHMVYEADLSQVEPGEEASVIEGVMAVIGNRINPLGVTEPIIQRQGKDRILIELPGIDITDKEKERLSRGAILEVGGLAADEEAAKWGNAMGRRKPATALI
ncbi:MAG: hypothetical protein H8D89_00395 [Dehalococcoidia bacterium]|nr:hypothetical protein [Dehalococcoidia bacterium]